MEKEIIRNVQELREIPEYRDKVRNQYMIDYATEYLNLGKEFLDQVIDETDFLEKYHCPLVNHLIVFFKKGN